MCITDLFPIPAGPPEGRRSGAGPAGGSCLYDWQDDVKTCLCWTALDDAIGLLNCSSEMNQGIAGTPKPSLRIPSALCLAGRKAWCLILGLTTLSW